MIDVQVYSHYDPHRSCAGHRFWTAWMRGTVIDWLDPMVQHGMRQRIKYVRLVRRKASSPHAQGADKDGNRYYVQLVLEGRAAVKPKHVEVGKDIIGLDIAWCAILSDGVRPAVLIDVIVHPHWQRQGIGQALVSAAVSHIRAHHISIIHVDFEPEHKTFYERCGFRTGLGGIYEL